jgi:hypothetical protein
MNIIQKERGLELEGKKNHAIKSYEKFVRPKIGLSSLHRE